MAPDTGLAEQYHFADFTRVAYRDLIRLAKQTYTFRAYDDFGRDERFVLWRHDVDFSVHSARALARIEADEGVVATYFVHPHSEYYNVLERTASGAVSEILAMGHKLGLHFDSHFYGIQDEESLDARIRDEARLLESVFGHTVTMFSFHNTTPFTMACRRWEYGGLINTYASYFQEEVGYCSDSNGYWRHRRLRDVLESATDERLQVLTHDAWWQEEAMTPRAKVARSVLGRAVATLAQYDSAFGRGGDRQNVCEIAPALEPVTVSDPGYAAAIQALWFSGLRSTVLIELVRRYHESGSQVPQGIAPADWQAVLEVRDRVLRGDRSMSDATLVWAIAGAARAVGAIGRETGR